MFNAAEVPLKICVTRFGELVRFIEASETLVCVEKSIHGTFPKEESNYTILCKEEIAFESKLLALYRFNFRGKIL